MSLCRVDAAALRSSLRSAGRYARRQRSLHLAASCDRLLGSAVRRQRRRIDAGGRARRDLHYVVASSGPSQLLEQAQLDTGEGPCVDTYVRDELTVSTNLAETRATRCSPRWSCRTGSAAVLGVPVSLSETPIGSLDLYVDRP